MYKIIAMLVCLMIRLWICIFKSWQIILHLNFTWISCPRKLMWPNYFIPKVLSIKYCSWNQCDQIGRFFAIWASIQSWWHQLFYPNCPHWLAIFVKVSKSFIIQVKSFWATFINIWRFFTGRTASKQLLSACTGIKL